MMSWAKIRINRGRARLAATRCEIQFASHFSTAALLPPAQHLQIDRGLSVYSLTAEGSNKTKAEDF